MNVLTGSLSSNNLGNTKTRGPGRAGISKDSMRPTGGKKAITKKQEQVPTLSVLFVEQTKGGALAKQLQQAELDLGMKTGFKVRVVENAGTALKRIFSSTNPWGSRECGRPDCVVCSQGDEKIQDCRRRNIVYENRCTACHVESKMEDPKLTGTGKGIYVGESSRSMYERGKEHEADRVGELEESHQIKHWVLDHPELDAPPKFKFKGVSSFRDALTRQLSEAVRIELRGEDILNSKSEFNRCKMPRLKIDLKGWRKEKEMGKATTIIPEGGMEDADLTRRMEMEFEQEISLADMETSARRDDTKRKADGRGSKSQDPGI